MKLIFVGANAVLQNMFNIFQGERLYLPLEFIHPPGNRLVMPQMLSLWICYSYQ